MITLYECVECLDGTWRLGNSFEVDSKKEAKKLIEEGKAKVIELPRFEVPSEWKSKKEDKGEQE